MRKQQRSNIGRGQDGRPKSAAPRSLVFTASASSAERAAKRAQYIDEMVKAANPVTALDHINPRPMPAPSTDISESNSNARTNRPRVPLFVPPRKQEEKPPEVPLPPSVVVTTTITTTSINRPRRFLIKRDNISGIHCFSWGDDESPEFVVILVQKSKEDFDFCQFLDSVSLLRTKFVLLDQFSWGTALVETLQVLIRSISSKNVSTTEIIICAGGSACWPCLEALNALKLRESTAKSVIAAAFVYPDAKLDQYDQDRRLSGLVKFPIYLEVDVLNEPLERALIASEARITTCLDTGNLQEFLRSQRKSRVSEAFLTQYSPSSQEQQQNILRLEGEGLSIQQTQPNLSVNDTFSILCLVCDVQNNYQMRNQAQLPTQIKQLVQLWGILRRVPSMRLVEWVHPTLSLKRGDVLVVPCATSLRSTSGVEEEEEDNDDDEQKVALNLSKATVMKRDDPIRAAFVRLAHQTKALPGGGSLPLVMHKNQKDEFLPLTRLISGVGLDEGRANLRVQVLQINKHKHELIVRDASLPEGTFCRVSLPQAKGFASSNASSLHCVKDFVLNSTVELRNVRIELDSRDRSSRFKACLDNKSGKSDMIFSAISKRATGQSSCGLKFASLASFLQQKSSMVDGEYRIQGARIKDVLFQGFSWMDAMKGWRNIFKWSDCLVEKAAGNDVWQFRSCIVVLTVVDADEDAAERDFAIVVEREHMNEILPFVKPHLLRDDDLDSQHRHLLLLKKVLDAVTYPKNKACEFALRISNANALPELLTMDI